MGPRRRYYGIAEVADALGQPRQLVTAWRRRRSWGMPLPDDELSSGPVWRGETIEPWIDLTRARLAAGDVAPATPGPALVRRVGRRVLRLAALVLEEEQRPGLLARARAELVETRTEVEATADSPARAALLQLYEVTGEDGARAADPAADEPALAEVVGLLSALLPLLTEQERTGIPGE